LKSTETAMGFPDRFDLDAISAISAR